MRVLVCGSRDWTDRQIVFAVLDGLVTGMGDDPELVLIHGACRGADLIAADWAQAWHHDIEAFSADWDKHGKAAGPIRNQQMLDEGKPDVLIAFKDGFAPDPTIVVRTIDGVEKAMSVKGRQSPGGTEDCIRRAKAMGIPTYVISHG